MRSNRLNRRAFLAGVGGVTVSLPWLESFNKPAWAAPDCPSRYLVAFAGMSVSHRRGTRSYLEDFVPERTGLDFDLKRAIEPLASVRSDISLVTGLRIRGTGAASTASPQGGAFHSASLSPLLSGTSSNAGNGQVRNLVHGETSDRLVAEAIGEGTRFRSLNVRVQAEGYKNGAGSNGQGHMSYRRLANGQLSREDPQTSPESLFNALFGTFSPPGGEDSPAAERQRRLLAQDRSILDLVNRRNVRLNPQLSAADQRRIEQHFEEIRQLELRILDTTEPPPESSACERPDQPPRDGRVNDRYADEEQRARIMSDLIYMAFVCDLTRSVALMYTTGQCYMRTSGIIPGAPAVDIHELSHGQGDPHLHADALAWHLRHYAYLIERLRQTPEGEGSVLDNCGMILLFEGGGLPGTGDPHSTENMATVVAGRVGGLRPQGHLVARDIHPTRCVVSVMQAVGGPSSLGEITEGYDSLMA